MKYADEEDELPSEAASGEPRKRLWLVMVVRTAAAAGSLPYLVSSQFPKRAVIGMVLAAERTTGVVLLDGRQVVHLTVAVPPA